MKDRIISWVSLTLGAIVAAFALEEFLVPNNIFDGGVTGVSMILTHFLPVSLGLLVIIINIPFLLIGLRQMGKRFLVKVTYSLILFSVMTSVFEPLQNVTDDIILAVTFGGVLLGIGVGLVLRGGGCLDGTEIVGILLNRKFSFSVGQVVLIINVIIYFVAGLTFGMDRGMYSLLMYFITSRVIDMVEMGWDNTKSVMIITDDGRELAQRIYKELGRTVTFMKGEGFVSNESKDILYCVVTRAEIFELKKVIASVEGSTFTTISEVSEIVGKYVKSTEALEEKENGDTNASGEQSGQAG